MNAQETLRRACEISDEMVVLAHAQSWEALTAKEAERATLFRQLPPATDISDPTGVLRGHIEHIQRCDAEIRSHVEPWMRDAQTLLRALHKPGSQ